MPDTAGPTDVNDLDFLASGQIDPFGGALGIEGGGQADQREIKISDQNRYFAPC